MKAEARFLNESKAFWANVRTISQHLGYTDRKTRNVRVHAVAEMAQAMRELGLGSTHLIRDGQATELGQKLHDYFAFRAKVLNEYVQPRLMDVDRAREVYHDIARQHTGSCPLPYNKQKGDKAGPAYLTCIVNLLVERHAKDLPVDYDPRVLTTVTYNDAPLRTLSRRVDGAFPGPVNPIAIWEIKEYYYTTTFGSRIADGVYETLLDGMELEELEKNANVTVDHLLIVDSHYTWWVCGRSYLCRIIDMLHMGFVDTVLFGYETVEQLPDIVAGWLDKYHERVAG
jgi:hypothetical protein